MLGIVEAAITLPRYRTTLACSHVASTTVTVMYVCGLLARATKLVEPQVYTVCLVYTLSYKYDM